MSKKDVSSLIERLPRFEKRAKVRLEGLSAFAESYDDEYVITVRGEAHSIDGDEIQEDVTINISLLDKSGRIVGVGAEYFAESFFGFQTIDAPVELSGTSLAKIRIVPKRDG